MEEQIQIFATDLQTNERIEITDLYFFEEEGIHDFSGAAFYTTYIFEIYINGEKVYPTKKEK